MTTLELQLSRDAATSALPFAVLADMAEERGEPAAVCAAIRDLPAVAATIRGVMARFLAEVEGASVFSVQINRSGQWRIWPERDSPVGGWWPEHFRGDSAALGVAVDHYDAMLPALDALGVALGFAVLDCQRTVRREVLGFVFARR